MLVAVSALQPYPLRRPSRGTDDIWAESGPGKLSGRNWSTNTRPNRREGDGRPDRLVGFPDQGLYRIQCQGHALYLIVGDGQLARARPRRRALRGPDQFFNATRSARGARRRLPRSRLRQYPGQLTEVLGDSRGRRRRRLSYREDWLEDPKEHRRRQGQVTATTRVPKGWKALRDTAGVLLPARAKALRHRDLHRQLL